ncbi:hypothetical protein HQ563_16545 [bacterium]|nr:hypothetical protein [bacterium]
MGKLWFVVGMCGILSLGSTMAAEKLSDFKAKAPEVAERTKAALESAAFKGLQQEFKEKRVAARFLVKGARTAKFLNAKDKKEYFLTAVPIVSHFRMAAPPLAALIISNGDELRAGSLKVSPDRRRELTCTLQASGGKLVAKAKMMETLREPPLPVPRGESAIAIAKNPEGDERILVLCRSPYPAKKENEMECLAVVFYSGDLAWEKFTPPSEGKEK